MADKGRTHWIRKALGEYQRPLTVYALRLTGDIERARDVVQDTFLQLCRAEPASIRERLAEWLFTVCRNKALTERRKENRMTTLSEVQLHRRPSPDPGPAETVELHETARQILEAIQALPPNQQEVVRLKFQNGMSYKEISNITGHSVSNVGFLLHTALNQIRKRMAREAARPLTQRRIK